VTPAHHLSINNKMVQIATGVRPDIQSFKRTQNLAENKIQHSIHRICLIHSKEMGKDSGERGHIFVGIDVNNDLGVHGDGAGLIRVKKVRVGTWNQA